LASRKGKQVERAVRVLLVAARLAQDVVAAACAMAERRTGRRPGDASIQISDERGRELGLAAVEQQAPPRGGKKHAGKGEGKE